MELCKRIPALLLCVLLLVSFGRSPEMVVRGAHLCKVRSKVHKARCSSQGNCQTVCTKSEGLLNGRCKGIIFRRCYCMKNCDD